MEEQELRAILGKNVKFYRTQKSLSQAELAEKVEISVSFLSNIERGNSFPFPNTLCKLSKVLNVEVFELFKGKLVPSDSKELIYQISLEVTEHVSDIFRQYLGQGPDTPPAGRGV